MTLKKKNFFLLPLAPRALFVFKKESNVPVLYIFSPTPPKKLGIKLLFVLKEESLEVNFHLKPIANYR